MDSIKDDLRDEINILKRDIEVLKTLVHRYEISTKLDYEKIESLKEEIKKLRLSTNQVIEK